VERDDATAVLAWYQRVYLVDDILFKSDRASMANSLELRTPFLDLDLAEYVNALPRSMKLRGGVRKHLLRQAIKAWQREGLTLPTSVMARKKRGFGIPIASWFRGPLASLARERILDGWPRQLDFINAAEREALLVTHTSGSRDLYKELWALFVLSVWGEQWLTQ
jgi:asparagine synthase (glutamine-hydrolysing)